MGTQDQRIAEMTFASVYPMYVAKVEKKERTKKELDQEELIQELYRQIGQLKVDLDWLKKKSGLLP